MSPNQTPGADTEVIDATTPLRSISSMDFCGVQARTCGRIALTPCRKIRSRPGSER